MAQIAPLVIEQQLLDQQVAQLEQAADVAAADETVDIIYRTKIQHSLLQKRQDAVAAGSHLEGALEHMRVLTLETASSISGQVSADRDRYGDAMRAVAAAEPEALMALCELAERCTNRGSLLEGDEVLVITGDHEMGDRHFEKARVVRCPTSDEEDTYTLDLWQVQLFNGKEYKEGYNFRGSRTESTCRARHQVYARDKKHRQKLSSEAMALSQTALTVPGPTSAAFLLLLYADAERALPHLTALGERICASCGAVRAVSAPLKGMQRAAVKTLEKYGGDFSRLTDLARCTFECDRLADVLAVLRALAADVHFEILLVKNRLDLAFDAEPAGGYRDLLLNLSCASTGHIVEVQVTLTPLLQVKKSGGHAAYSLARLLHLNEARRSQHTGSLDADGLILRLIGKGIVRHLELLSSAAALSSNFDGLCASIRAPSCVLSKVELRQVDWPNGRPVSDLLDALAVLGPKLRHLTVSDLNGCGTLSTSFLEACHRIEHLALIGLGLVGTLPAVLGQLAHLRSLILMRNAFEGGLPDLRGCKQLTMLALWANQLSGPIGSTLDDCPIATLYLHHNRLDGELPDFSKLTRLMDVQLHANSFSGELPASLYRCCTRLEHLHLSNNKLTGTIDGAALAEMTTLRALHLRGNPGLSMSNQDKELVLRTNATLREKREAGKGLSWPDE